jgi:predicted heme/steroid binding protein
MEDSSTRYPTLEEVSKHSKKGDNWIIISGQVYDVTEWSRRHPGGSRLLNLLAGQDATVGTFMTQFVWYSYPRFPDVLYGDVVFQGRIQDFWNGGATSEKVHTRRGHSPQ